MQKPGKAVKIANCHYCGYFDYKDKILILCYFKYLHLVYGHIAGIIAFRSSIYIPAKVDLTIYFEYSQIVIT